MGSAVLGCKPVAEITKPFEDQCGIGEEKAAKIRATTAKPLIVKNLINTRVAPSRHTPKGLYSLSNLDQTIPYVFEIVFTFHAQGRSSDTTAEDFHGATMRGSLAEALVRFYPLAGKLVMGRDGKMAVDCTGEGVPFVEAVCEDGIEVLGDVSLIEPTKLRKLVNCFDDAKSILDHPLLTVQLTRFKCGGIVVGIALNHVIADGKALTDFITCWTEIARSKHPLSIEPRLDRSIFFPKKLPSHRIIVEPRPEYTGSDRVEKIMKHPPRPYCETMVYRSFCFSPFVIDRLQKKMVTGTFSRDCNSWVPTSFEIISALVWVFRTKALRIQPHEKTKLLTAVDSRSKCDPPIPSGYFGNGLAWSCAECIAHDLTTNPFNHALTVVHEAIQKVDDAYVRSAIDYVELTRSTVDDDVNTCYISKWSTLGWYDMDFGWGSPDQVAPVSVPNNTMLVLRKNRGSKSLVVSLGLPAYAMDDFEMMVRSEMMIKSNL